MVFILGVEPIYGYVFVVFDSPNSVHIEQGSDFFNNFCC